jgi:hypothetical protein
MMRHARCSFPRLTGGNRGYLGEITMINPDDGQWLTYREAAVVLGLTPEGVRSLARRKGWSRQTPNEIGGVARVLLPTGLHRRERPDPTDATTGVARRDTVGLTVARVV